MALLALAVAVLALRRADVVERRARTWLAEAPHVEPTGPAERPAIPDLSGRSGAGALRRVSVVRYDAFEDLGGRLSFSAAILDDAGRGLVLTAIHGRSETRSYLKQIPGEDTQRQLSPEEQQAVQQAMRGDS